MSFTAIQFNDLALGNMPCLVEHFYIKGFADGAWHIVLSIYRVGFKPYSISYIITTIIKMQVYLLTWYVSAKATALSKNCLKMMSLLAFCERRNKMLCRLQNRIKSIRFIIVTCKVVNHS